MDTSVCKRGCKVYFSLSFSLALVYHYQMKMHVFSYKNLGETEPTFLVTLHGTNGDSQPLSLEM